MAEVRKQLEDILNKNGELSRANGDLRHKITELEYQMKEQRDKLAAQKRHVEHLTKIRQKQDKTINSYEVRNILVYRVFGNQIYDKTLCY